MKRLILDIQKFASVNSYTITRAYETDVNTTNNTSYVYVECVVTTNSGTYNNTGNAYYNINASVGGQSKGTGNINYTISTSSSKTFSAKLGPFTHNADGTLGNVSVSSYCYITSSKTYSVSTSVGMSTIPRKSNIGGFTANIDSGYTISWSRASNSFTHTLRYSFGNLSGTIATGQATSYTWTMPTSFYGQIGTGTGSGTSKTGTIYLDTYNGSTLIGTSSATFTANSRRSGIGAVSSYVDVAKAISWNRSNSGFKHILKYSFGSLRGTIASNLDTSYTWTMPTSFYAQIGTATNSAASKDGTIYLETYDRGALVGTTSAKLTATSRKSIIGSFTGYVDNATAISWTRYNNNFRHTITYSFGSLSGTIGTNKEGSLNWTIPTSFYAQIGASATQKSGTIYVYTYTSNGGTLVGTSSASFTAYTLESKCRPSITFTAYDNKASTSQLSAGASTSKIVISGQSNIYCNWSGTKALNSATIASITLNGSNMSTSATNYTYNNATANTYKLVVKDSRGYSNTATVTLGLKDYVPVTISGKAKRTDATKQEVRVEASGNYWSGNFGVTNNTLTVQYSYLKGGTSTWSNWFTMTPSASGKTFTATANNATGISNESQYTFRFRAIDKINTGGYTNDVPVTKTLPIIKWNNDNFHCFGTITQASLESRKKDITKFNNAMEIINNGEIYEWRYLEDAKDSKKHIGFVIPDKGGDYIIPLEVINKYGEGIELYTVCGILWKAVQELQKELDELKESDSNE